MVTTRSSTINKHGRIWVKQDCYTPLLKVEITKSDSTVVDVSTDIITCSVGNGVSNFIGNFTISLSNANGKYTKMFNGGEIVNIWMGYSSTGYIKQMSGEIDNPTYSLSKNEGRTLNLNGTAYGYELLEITINKQYTSREASTLLTNTTDGVLVGTNITTSNVQTTSVTFGTLTFRNKYRWDCIREICEKVQYDAYVDTNKDLHFFPEGSIVSTKEAVVVGDNLISLSSNMDRKKVKNKIVVFGKDLESDVQFIKTEEDTTSQASYRIKELVIDESSIDSMDEIEERASYELNSLKDPIQEGQCTSLGLPQLNPGEKIRISSPLDNINGDFVVKSFTHTFSKTGGFITAIQFGKQNETLDKFFKDRKIVETNTQKIFNPFNMTNSYVIDFEDDTNIDTYYYTIIENGALRLTPGATTGLLTSSILTANSSITSFELRANENGDCGDCTYDISLDGGNTFDTNVQKYTEVTPTNTSGNQIVIKINMNSTSNNNDPRIFAVGLLYKFN